MLMADMPGTEGDENGWNALLHHSFHTHTDQNAKMNSEAIILLEELLISHALENRLNGGSTPDLPGDEEIAELSDRILSACDLVEGRILELLVSHPHLPLSIQDTLLAIFRMKDRSFYKSLPAHLLNHLTSDRI